MYSMCSYKVKYITNINYTQYRTNSCTCCCPCSILIFNYKLNIYTYCWSMLSKTVEWLFCLLISSSNKNWSAIILIIYCCFQAKMPKIWLFPLKWENLLLDKTRHALGCFSLFFGCFIDQTICSWFRKIFCRIIDKDNNAAALILCAPAV